MGKSTCAELLRAREVPGIDTDVIARQVVEPGQPALAEVISAFGRDLLDADGRLRRDTLAQRVFADAEARRRLESLLHPRIRTAWLAQVAQWREEGHPVVAVVIPLLFETNATAEFSSTVCVACSEATQQERLRQRGWTPEEIGRRRNAQWPIEKKMTLSTYVIWTEGGISVHARQLDRILERI